VFDEKTFPYKDHAGKFVVSSGNAQVPTPIAPTLSVIHSPHTDNILSDNGTHSVTHASFITPSILSSAPSTNLPLRASGLSPHTTHSEPPSIPVVAHPTNTHAMVTRAKVGVHKPKVYHDAVTSLPLIPTSLKEVIASLVWLQAMREEYDALLSNKTWTLTPLPLGAPLVGCKWIFKTKLNADGSLQRCKTRLVVKGFHQIAGIDYAKTFSPVVCHSTIRLVLAHVVSSRWSIQQININNAFLNGDLQECVFMQQPPGFNTTTPHLVCQLNKAIYGLKQAPRS